MSDNLKSEFWMNKKLSKSAEAVTLEQYKLALEMADRISDRRDKANAFFLTLNFGIVTSFGFIWDKHLPLDPKGLIIVPMLFAIGFCIFWYRLVTSYRNLNSVKFKLIQDMEERLPVRFWKIEWEMLGKGEDAGKYIPFSHIEQKLPWMFMAFYVIGAATYIWC